MDKRGNSNFNVIIIILLLVVEFYNVNVTKRPSGNAPTLLPASSVLFLFHLIHIYIHTFFLLLYINILNCFSCITHWNLAAGCCPFRRIIEILTIKCFVRSERTHAKQH